MPLHVAVLLRPATGAQEEPAVRIEVPDGGSVGPAAGPDGGQDAVSFTLRQLMALRELDAEAYEADELLEGLPEVEP